jgi:protein involved in polysaccharide export with SLBB domain
MARFSALSALVPLAAATLVAGCGSFAPGPYGGRPQAAVGGPGYIDPGRGLGPGGAPATGFADIGYATWQETEPEYRLYPGDQIDVTVLSAPELNRAVTVQPDGRISVPLLQPLMVADRPIPEVEAALAAGYATQLVRPQVSISLRLATPLRIFVGGEVDKPGIYDMPGDIDALQAVIMAGGFRTSGNTSDVVIIRRGPGGRPMARTANLNLAAKNPGLTDAVPLRRFDVVIVPRKAISSLALFVQQYLRDPLPVQFSYVINGQVFNSR